VAQEIRNIDEEIGKVSEELKESFKQLGIEFPFRGVL
jgi:hypothetical protein